ncbi:MAG: succinate dehydrogenase [Pseudomonadota bacterium]
MIAERSRPRAETLLWVAQRASAAVLAVCVAVHLATIVYAVRGGLSAAEILTRTRASLAWLAFYAIFVAAAAVHAPIGLRAILRETTSWRGPAFEGAILAFAVVLALAGWRAVGGLFV